MTTGPMTNSALTPPAMDHAGRLARLRAALAGAGVDALVVTNLINVRYLSGFTGSNATMAVTAEAAVLVTDGRYRDQAGLEIDAAGAAVEVRIESADVDGALAEVVGGATSIGLEAATVSWARQRRLAERLAPATLVPLEDTVERLRATKDAGEIDRIERAAQLADAALGQCLGRLTGRPTEREFALLLETTMRRMGADGPSFDTIVAAGPNAALPHARPSQRRVERGDLVVVDFGALVEGYRSDMTRTVCVGTPSPEQRRLLDTVLHAQAAGRDSVRAGVVAGHVDAVCRGVIDAAGLGEAFSHGTGHGLGLQIHEYPILSRNTTGELGVDYVVTVEPGVYVRDVGGVRIEDTVVVGPDGCRSLTQFPKHLEL
jgi:Xaa-Pro aminopeptidase